MTELLEKTKLLARLQEATESKKPLSRTLEFKVMEKSIDLDARTVELAFSSDAPYLRWDGFEILGHEPGEIDLARMNNKAPLLFMHNWDDQLGVIESVEIDSKSGVGRAIVRFGKGEFAESKFKDVQDGILTKVSVGYQVLKWKDVTEEGAETSSYRVTEWMPFEISMVTIAADDDVGVGRSLEMPPMDKGSEKKTEDPKEKNISITKTKKEESNKMEDFEKKIEQERLAAEAKTNATRNGAQAEAERQSDIRSIARSYGVAPEVAEEYLSNHEKTPGDFTQRVLKIVSERSNGGKDKDGTLKQAKKLNEMDGDGTIGMSVKQAQAFSFVKFINAQINPNTKSAQKDAAFEIECCEAAAEKKNGNDSQARGLVIPLDVLMAPMERSLGQAMQRIVSTTTPVGGPGSNLIATDLLSGSFIDLLTNRTTAMQLMFLLTGLVGNVDIPRQSGAGTGFWLGEDGTVTASDQEYDQISLTPKTAGARTQVTRKMMQQSSLDIEALTRFDIARTLGLTIDLAAYYGTGSSNQPTGVTAQAGINTVTFAGVLPTYAEVVAMETAIAADNADIAGMAYVLPATMRGHLKTTQKFSGTNGQPIWEPGNQVNGYRADVTNQITVSELIFGNFKDAIIGMWGGLDLIVDPYTDSNRGRINLTAFQDIDIAVRHPESFCHGSDFV